MPPSARRANIVVSGIDLAATMGKTIQVGDVRVTVHGETKPCERMDEARQGLRQALVPDCRGGVYGGIIEGVRRVALRPSMTYTLDAFLPWQAPETGTFRLRVEYSPKREEPPEVIPLTAYSNSFEIQ